jgi:hypothetical protein
MTWNKTARKRIAEICEERGIERCEVCGGTFGVAPAHRDRRDHYRSWEELSDFNNWICLCQPCHEKLDNRAKTTKQQSDDLFDKLRG